MKSEKSILRETMRERLGDINARWRTVASEELVKKVMSLEMWWAAKVIGLFAGQMDEVETSLFWEPGKKFVYPKMVGDEMIFMQVRKQEELVPGKLGLLEPTRLNRSTPDLVIVPGLAFDAKGGRLGRGKGFYDRWIAENPAVLKVGVCFDFQMVGQVPMEDHDRAVNLVVTEKATYRV